MTHEVEMRGGIPVSVCQRTGCGHPKHNHLKSSPGNCVTETISGPPSMVPPTMSNPHPGRTITACQCPGFLA